MNSSMNSKKKGKKVQSQRDEKTDSDPNFSRSHP